LDDRIEVDGRRVQVDLEKKYFAMNKPAGVITSSVDPKGRTTVMDLVGEESRLYPVGRLDMSTEGLLILTNDGDLAHRMTHPSYEMPKTYVVEVKGMFGRAAVQKLTKGVEIEEGKPAVATDVKILDSLKGADPRTVVQLSVHEGRNHVVRRMMEATGYRVNRLTRTAVGPIKLGRLADGSYRNLTREEVADLYSQAGL